MGPMHRIVPVTITDTPDGLAELSVVTSRQRIPVRIAIGDLPKGVTLRVGTTASVLVRGGSGEKTPHPVPRALQ